MSLYCFVEDGKAGYTGSLPSRWRNISGLNLASDADLKGFGWLPYTEENATISKYEVRDGISYTITADSVVGTEQKRDMTDAEKKGKDDSDANGYQIVRRNEYGTWESQLDMMYHGTWEAHVKKIKADNPKP
jgi:hypothetical protein